ncbi:hypothetical protein LJB42_000702 [Komagataella kurtzmanii]|nr:hypothetical protein LJB42_000702 [Komagataella kurtzmanii]
MDTNQSTPSLIGTSIRGAIDTPDRELFDKEPPSGTLSPSKTRHSKSLTGTLSPSYVTVNQLKEGGALLNDGYTEQLNSVMDGEGHIKEDALDLKQKLYRNKDAQNVSRAKLVSLSEISANEEKYNQEFYDPEMRYAAPACSLSGSRSRAMESDDIDKDKESLISREATPMKFELTNFDSSSSLRLGAGASRPHLARGDSYQQVHPSDFGHNERLPRHERTQSSVSSSSINYLRSLSRSRSRLNRSAHGDNATQEELKEEGVLTNDQYSPMPELTEAVDEALKPVDGHVDIEDEDENEGSESDDQTEEETEKASLQEGEPEVGDQKETNPVKDENPASKTGTFFLEESSSESTQVADSFSKATEAKKEDVAGSETKVAPSDQISDKQPSETLKPTDPKSEAVAEETKHTSESKVTSTDDLDDLMNELELEIQGDDSHPLKGSLSTSKAEGDDPVYVPQNTMAFENEPVYLFTSLAGGFQVASRTNRLQTILAANQVAFQMKDLGTDEEARKVWKRYSSGKSLPGIVRGKDDFIGNWEDIEDANENYEVRSLIYETV